MSNARSAETEAREARQRYREVVANVLGTLRSQEINRSYASFSLEEAIDQQIERIEGAGTDTLPNLLTRVDRIKSEFDGAIAGIKATDPDLFRAASTSDDANTPRDEGDT